jgi:hypothetical protein
LINITYNINSIINFIKGYGHIIYNI